MRKLAKRQQSKMVKSETFEEFIGRACSPKAVETVEETERWG